MYVVIMDDTLYEEVSDITVINRKQFKLSRGSKDRRFSTLTLTKSDIVITTLIQIHVKYFIPLTFQVKIMNDF